MKGLKLGVALLVMVALAIPVLGAGVKFATVDDAYMKLGGRIQLQYYRMDPAGGDASDSLFFRRFRPYIEGSVHEDWTGKFQWDMGKGELDIKDAYMEYKGFDGMSIFIGNANFPFSRELLTSSKYQQLVERTFVGDHNYGTPDRQTGVHLVGKAFDKKLTWGASVCKAMQDPDNKKLDFEPAVNKGADDTDWSEGNMIGGRVDYHPFGELKYSQGDFDGKMKATIGAAAFAWQNDDDNLDPERSKKDVDKVTGFELSAAFRYKGFSADAEYNMFSSELVEDGITSGLYENSETDLVSYSLEAGYMILPSKLELVAGYSAQDADNYDKAWTRIAGGLNWFVHKHDIKYQLTYQVGENKDGKEGSDVDEIFLQAQYVF